MSDNRPALLQVNRLTKRYGGVTAVDDCTFSVEPSRITALIGPNGAGKTTVLNLINGLATPTAGQIQFRGIDITSARAYRVTRLGIGRTFQIGREFANLSCLENVALHAYASSFKQLMRARLFGGQQDQAMELLDFVGLTTYADVPAGELSYGQRKLLGLAAVLMGDPSLIILDEPAGGINPALLEDIEVRIRSLNADRQITFLIVEHNMDLVMDLSDWVIVLDQGSVLSEGPPSIIQEDERVLTAYLGKRER